MRQLLNTLYVQTQGSYLRLESETVRVDVDGKKVGQIPLHHLSGIVTFGNVLLSPFLLHRCAEDGRAVVWLSQYGRFKGRLAGPTQGNVLLRRAQHDALCDPARTLAIARFVVAGKLQNAKVTLQRSARENADEGEGALLREAAREMLRGVGQLPLADTLDEVRGIEGTAARVYFEVFTLMVRQHRPYFEFVERSRRPPRDPINALLSFVYTLVRSDCVAALESVGLDPQLGFLHTLRPGRPALALDMMEEFRAVLADRLVLTLINRQQIQPGDVIEREGGAVTLTDDARKVVLSAYQKRKQEELSHGLLRGTVPFGLVPHLQARLLARHLRGDLPHYPPYLHR